MTHVTIERSKVITAPPEIAWKVISDLDGYHDHVTGLDTTEVVSGEGVGAVRHCVDTTGGDWYETCDIWEPGRRYSVNVDISTYPLKYRMLFSAFRGTWTVDPVGDQSRIGMTFDAELRRLPFVGLLVRRLAAGAGADLDRTIASYEASAAG